MRFRPFPVAILFFALFAANFTAASAYGLTWTGNAPVANNLWGTTSPTHNNWTPGVGDVAWTQGADALFDGEPALLGGQPVRVVGGAIQFNSLTVQNIADSAMTIGRVSGNDADHLQAVGIATVNVPTGTALTLPRVAGSVGLKLNGGGTLVNGRDFTFTGGLTVLGGTFQSLPTAANGTVTLLDTSGAADARIYIRGVNSSWNMSNDVHVQGGGTGLATIENHPSTSSGFNPTLSGNITLDSNLRIFLNGTQTNSITHSGDMSGAGKLFLQASNTQRNFILSGNNSGHSGAIEMLSANQNLTINGTLGNSNILTLTGTTITGSGTLNYNVNGGTGDLITLVGTSTIDLSNLSLNPLVTNPTLDEYVIINAATGVIGEFLNTNGYVVEYNGTLANPNSVVLLIPPTAPIPEPGSLLLIGLGCVGLLGQKRGRRDISRGE